MIYWPTWVWEFYWLGRAPLLPVKLWFSFQTFAQILHENMLFSFIMPQWKRYQEMQRTGKPKVSSLNLLRRPRGVTVSSRFEESRHFQIVMNRRRNQKVLSLIKARSWQKVLIRLLNSLAGRRRQDVFMVNQIFAMKKVSFNPPLKATFNK